MGVASVAVDFFGGPRGARGAAGSPSTAPSSVGTSIELRSGPGRAAMGSLTLTMHCQRNTHVGPFTFL